MAGECDAGRRRRFGSTALEQEAGKVGNTKHREARGTPRKRRSGYTILEVISASVIIGLVMAPSAALLRDILQTSSEVETTNVLATLGVSKLEEQLGVASHSFRNDSFGDTFADAGHPELRYRVVRTQTRRDGGIPGFLMAVIVDVWHDRDGNGQLDRDEPRLQFVSKVSQP